MGFDYVEEWRRCMSHFMADALMAAVVKEKGQADLLSSAHQVSSHGSNAASQMIRLRLS